MANLRITHFTGVTKDYESPIKECDILDITTARCFPVLENTTLVSLVSDTDVHFEFGVNPKATSKSTLLPAKKVEYFSIDLNISPLLSVCDGFTAEHYAKLARSSKMWFEL